MPKNRNKARDEYCAWCDSFSRGIRKGLRGWRKVPKLPRWKNLESRQKLILGIDYTKKQWYNYDPGMITVRITYFYPDGCFEDLRYWRSFVEPEVVIRWIEKGLPFKLFGLESNS